MKHIKLFEQFDEFDPFGEEIRPHINIDEIEVGDYVICHQRGNIYSPELKKLIGENIGKVISIEMNLVEVRYDNCKDYGGYNNITIDFLRDEVIYWSKNKEELEKL